MENAKMPLSFSKYKKADYITGTLLLSITIGVIWMAISSIGWRIYHDSPIMLYVAMLIDKFDRIPYREIYEMNMPGTLFIYYVIGRITNYTDLGFRIVDLALLAGIMVTTYYWLRGISRKSAWGTAVIFAFIYLWFGPGNSLQRDYLLVALISCSFMTAFAFPRMNYTLSLLITGFLSAVAFLIKPHAILSFGLILLWQIYRHKDSGKSGMVKTIWWYCVGFLIPTLITVVYLWQNQALGSLIDIAKNYFPLYGHLNGQLTTIYGADRVRYNLINYFLFRHLWPLIIPAVLGCFVCLRNSSLPKEKKELIYLIILSAFIASIYPALSGQFFLYHYFMFLYFIIALVSLSLPYAFNNLSWQAIVPVVVMFLALSWVTLVYSGGQNFDNYNKGMAFVDSVADFLNENLQPGETVQPLDWTAGVLNGMLRAKAPLATSFTCDFQFYHDISDPYIQFIRQRFIAELEKSKPRYILWVNPQARAFVYGENTTMEFPELNSFINENYATVKGSSTFIIAERKKQR